MLIAEESFQLIEEYARLCSRNPNMEEQTAYVEKNNPKYKFLTDKYSPDHKYYSEYLTRLKKIDALDDEFSEKKKILEDKKIHITRRALVKVAMENCDLTDEAIEVVDKIIEIFNDSRKNTISDAKRKLKSIRMRNTNSIFKYINIKLFSKNIGNVDRRQAFTNRLNMIYLVNELLASQTYQFIDGFMESDGKSPCPLHILVSLAFELAEDAIFCKKYC